MQTIGNIDRWSFIAYAFLFSPWLKYHDMKYEISTDKLFIKL